MSSKEAMDLCGSRRRASAPKAGSVWESRIKIDQFKGGIKVFNATHHISEQTTTCSPPPAPSTTVNNPEVQMDNDVRPKQSPIAASAKRKTWKSEGTPIQIARKRSDLSKNLDENLKELSVSADGNGIKKSPVPIKKTRSVSSSDGNEKNAIQLTKVKSDSIEVKSEASNGDLKNPSSLELVKAKTVVERRVLDESNKSPIGVEKSRSDENCKEFDVCEDKSITSNVGQIKIPSDDDFADSEEEPYDEIEVEKKSLDIKEITVQEHKPKKIVIEDKKLVHNNQTPVPISPIVKNHARFHPIPTKTNPTSDHSHGISRTNSKLQSFVDLVMWRDASKSAFVFGIGTFAIISSSYTKDLNISFISVISYLGLVYLAAIFLFRSLITREPMEMDDNAIGEEEAIWAVKLFLPYVNEFLLKLRALFSGDPSTTMKLAVLLFILARCGSSITIWKMAKLGFIGVFTVPKVCSAYSSHLTAYEGVDPAEYIL